jgi:hypothetical protein
LNAIGSSPAGCPENPGSNKIKPYLSPVPAKVLGGIFCFHNVREMPLANEEREVAIGA